MLESSPSLLAPAGGTPGHQQTQATDYKIQVRRRPYRVECTGSLPTSGVKRRRARLVLGWGTAWEDLRVLSALQLQRQRCRVERSKASSLPPHSVAVAVAVALAAPGGPREVLGALGIPGNPWESLESPRSPPGNPQGVLGALGRPWGALREPWGASMDQPLWVGIFSLRAGPCRGHPRAPADPGS